ncbi:MAG: tRNA-(ms[2]io[6]A)-hydroxylase [Flavobacteriales bacterium]|nr:tRNA-(ms[2]io[6]A)-hydroxylase [Flavobacteriales bacterium]
MLGLKLATDPRWANIAESNIEGILSDHAWCEQKAASNAISLITSNPDKPDLVRRLTEIAIEEMEHFQMVIDIIKERNLSLHPENKDDYVNHLYKFMKRGEGKDQSLVDRLLFAAMIEARSCERFKVLSENIQDQELAKFYRDLMISEAEHYTTFITFAREYGGRVDVDQRWKEWLEFEDNLIRSYGVNQTIHG